VRRATRPRARCRCSASPTGWREQATRESATSRHSFRLRLTTTAPDNNRLHVVTNSVAAGFSRWEQGIARPRLLACVMPGRPVQLSALLGGPSLWYGTASPLAPFSCPGNRINLRLVGRRWPPTSKSSPVSQKTTLEPSLARIGGCATARGLATVPGIGEGYV
jgi:hypothetical protein